MKAELKRRKRRIGGRLKRMTLKQKKLRREHWERTGRAAKKHSKAKVIPGGDS